MGVVKMNWKVVQVGDYVKVVDSDGQVVSDLRLIHHPGTSDPVGWHNALLIAAAPDLLSACESLLALWLDYNPDDDCLCDCPNQRPCAQCQARAAIARVK